MMYAATMCTRWFSIAAVLLCSACAAVDLPVLDAEESVTPAAWFWGDVGGFSSLTRVQNELAPNYCQASWALSTVAALSDRLKISNPGAHPERALSPQVLLNCVGTSDCSVRWGGHPNDAFEYLHHQGVPDDTCQNYEGKEGTCDAMGICRDCTHGNRTIGEDLLLDAYCWAVEEYQTYTVTDYGRLEKDSETKGSKSMVQRMQEEIYTRGPMTCAIHPSPEFKDYKDGILSTSDATTDKAHYINIVGYWIGRNCWGEAWGNGGFFKIVMGVNALGVESECFWGVTALRDMPQNRLDDEKELDRGLYRVKKNMSPQLPCPCIQRPDEEMPLPSLSQPEVTNIDIPAAFDIRNINGKNYATVDKNQHIPVYCGSCWAFSAMNALADRYALLYEQAAPVFDLATQVVINCVRMSGGCRGGWPYFAYSYVKNHGLPHESCAPYKAVAETCSDYTTCHTCQEDGTCQAVPGGSFRRFGVVKHGVLSGKEMMQREILTGGPISCVLAITPEFLAYSGGIFNDTSCSMSTQHALEVTGWGEENGVEYWIVRNSWGTYWGENGWGRIAMGKCDLGLTHNLCDWAVPKPFEEALPYQMLLPQQTVT